VLVGRRHNTSPQLSPGVKDGGCHKHVLTNLVAQLPKDFKLAGKAAGIARQRFDPLKIVGALDKLDTSAWKLMVVHHLQEVDVVRGQMCDVGVDGRPTGDLVCGEMMPESDWNAIRQVAANNCLNPLSLGRHAAYFIQQPLLDQNMRRTRPRQTYSADYSNETGYDRLKTGVSFAGPPNATYAFVGGLR
jgi:hypothetical protein